MTWKYYINTKWNDFESKKKVENSKEIKRIIKRFDHLQTDDWEIKNYIRLMIDVTFIRWNLYTNVIPTTQQSKQYFSFPCSFKKKTFIVLSKLLNEN